MKVVGVVELVLTVKLSLLLFSWRENFKNCVSVIHLGSKKYHIVKFSQYVLYKHKYVPIEI